MKPRRVPRRPAPSRAVASRPEAAAVVARVIRAYSTAALACGTMALSSLLALVSLGAAGPASVWRAGLLIVMLALTAISSTVLEPSLERERRAVPDFDPRGGDNPHLRRAEFLQRLCLQVNGTILLLGLICLWLMGGAH